MGVTGLWRLIEPAGKPVPVETLENKVLAVDISIWLHQMVKGYQDAKGAPLPNAHLMGLFQRLCKLLYFRIKPVFVFDGGFPDLKKETIAKRQDSKSKYNSESERLKRELVLLLSKRTAIGSLLGNQISPKKGTTETSNDNDLFKLPALPQSEEIESESDDEESSSSSIVDLHSLDIQSDKFKSLPVKEKYDLLVELKETRKMNSWGRLHELPKKSDNFSDFQMQRLLKRRKVQECLEETEKEMGESGMSLNELESLLNEEGIDTKFESLPTRRIACNENTRFLLINNVKQALEDARKKKEAENKPDTKKMDEENPVVDNQQPKHEVKDELEDDLQKAIKMSLECVNEADTSACTKTDDSWTSFLTDSDYSNSDSEEEDGFEQPDMSSAKAYIMQYSDFTHKVINKMIAPINSNDKNKCNVPRADKIIEELNHEKSVIIDNVELSFGDEKTDSKRTGVQSHNDVKSTDEGTKSSIQKMSMNLTQSSVFCVQNALNDVITLDTSTEEEIKKSPEKPVIVDNVESSGDGYYCSKTTEVQSQIEFKSTGEDSKFSIQVIDEHVTQSSVDFVQSAVQDVITLNISTEHVEQATSNECENQSNSSDDEFEEVTDTVENNELNKPVVQLTLNMGEAPDDDIFADVFTDKKEPISKGNELSNTIELNRNELSKCTKYTIPQNIKENHESKDKTNNTDEIKKFELTNSKLEIKQLTNTIIDHNSPDKTYEFTTKIDNQVRNDDESASGKIINKEPKEVLSTEQLESMANEVQNEEQNLIQEKGRLDRIGRNITEQMTKEAQELLQIFGIPYIVAPTEAEAQCAFLESVNLTDGTITDDSDIWLFGGKTVYKNFFNHKKHVLQFLSERIEKSFNLTREQLVLLALLVGSDYTTGVNGVGPVTALEILASFPFNKKLASNETSKQARYNQIVGGLQEFKRWVRAGKRTDNTTLKKKLKNVNLTDDFPSIRVVQAYLEPNIEKSEEKFTWGELDITILRDYTKSKFGWSQNKLDEIIKPVLNRMRERKSQKTVQDYFKRKIEFQSLEDQMSKRVKAAVQRMGPEGFLEEEKEKVVNKKRVNKRKSTKDKSEDASKSNNQLIAGPSKDKQKRVTNEISSIEHPVKVVSETEHGDKTIEINIPKSDKFQEIIPQREKDKQNLLQNKIKAIEIFRKTKIDRKKRTTKRKVILPKEKAELSESSDSN